MEIAAESGAEDVVESGTESVDAAEPDLEADVGTTSADETEEKKE